MSNPRAIAPALAALRTNKPRWCDLPTRLRRFFVKYPPTKEYDPLDHPFRVMKHPVSNKTLHPRYTSDEQKSLYQLAKRFGVEGLLKDMPKNYEPKHLVIKPLVVFKKTIPQRTENARKQKIIDAMKEMPQMIAHKRRVTRLARRRNAKKFRPI